MTEQEMLKNNQLNQSEIEVVEEGINETPARGAKDHLPTKPGWKVLLSGIGYAAFGILLMAVVIGSITATGRVTGIGWFIVFVFGLGSLAACYSAFDELRHLKNALKLDKEGKVEIVTILDNWKDNYVDGGIMSRKEIYHISYRYAGGKEYAKHSLSRSVAAIFKTHGKIKVLYLVEDPKIYRPIIGE